MLDRRTAIGTLGAAALAAATGISAAPAPLRKPPRLRPGDMVGLIEPAGFTEDAFDLALSDFDFWRATVGLTIRFGGG